MIRTKTYQLIQSLSAKQRNAFMPFLKGSSIRENEALQDLFEYLIGRQSWAAEVPEKGEAYRHVFGSVSYDDQKMRLLLSALHRKVEKFIVIESASINTAASFKTLSKHYRLHGLDKHFTSNLNRWRAFLSGDHQLGAYYFDHLFDLENEQYEYLLAKQRAKELNLQPTHAYLDRGYIAKKLRQSCYALAHRSVFKKDYDLGLIDAVLRFTEERSLVDEPVIGVYYYAYGMLTDPQSEQSFDRFSVLLTQNEERFEPDELASLYILGINYCIRRLNDGALQHGQKGLQLYFKALDNGCLMHHGYLSHYTYRNVVTMAIRIGDFDRAEQFVHAYKAFLKSDIKESYFNFSLSLIHYEQKNYAEALESIRLADFKDHLIHLAAKTLQLKIYFELDEWDLLDFHLDAMQVYIQRKKVIGYHKQNYQNIIKFTRRLIKLRPGNTKRKERILKQIETESVLTERRWLLEKLDKAG